MNEVFLLMWALTHSDGDIMEARAIHATQTIEQCDVAKTVVAVANNPKFLFFCIGSSELTELRIQPY